MYADTLSLSSQNKYTYKNLRQNWYFPIFCLLFFYRYCLFSIENIIGLFIAVVFSCVMAMKIPSILRCVEQSPRWMKMISLLTTIGICWPVINPQYFIFSSDLLLLFGITSSIAFFFVYFWLVIFYKELLKIFCETKIFCDVKKTELFVYGLLIVASIFFIIFVFLKTDVFYGTPFPFDIIYTSDSPKLLKGNAYLDLTNFENDLRQPLFAVFAAPFIGIPNLISKIFCLSSSMHAILINIIQIILLFVAHFMLAKMIKLNSINRICFMLLLSFTYTNFLFILMLEQYIISYFYLIFCLYLIVNKQQSNWMIFYGAVGTLLISFIYLPFMSNKSFIKNFKQYFFDIVQCGFGFVLLMLTFCRFDIFFNLAKNIFDLNDFTEYSSKMIEKLFQYSAFICNYFIAPFAGISVKNVDYISWQLNPMISIQWAGIVIFFLSIISVFLNRQKKITQLSILWVFIGMLILLGLGWGIKENGLILYSLYLGWSFMVLLFQLIEWIELKFKIKRLIPILTFFCITIFIIVNISQIMALINFGLSYFPI